VKPHDWLADFEPDALVMEEHENALVGMCVQFGRPPVALYDYDVVIENLKTDGMSYEEAVEFFEFNIGGAWLGEYTPAFIMRYEDEDVAEKDVEPV